MMDLPDRQEQTGHRELTERMGLTELTELTAKMVKMVKTGRPRRDMSLLASVKFRA
jgi:hypothetical protein